MILDGKESVKKQIQRKMPREKDVIIINGLTFQVVRIMSRERFVMKLVKG